MSHYLSRKSILTFLLFSFVFITTGNAQLLVQVGNGTTETCNTCASPVNIYYESLHGQIIYTKAELLTAGAIPGFINKIGFEIASLPDYALPNYSVQIGHTTAADTSSYVDGNFSTVYFNPSYQPSLGFDLLTLNDPFLWNGEDNILIEMCFDPVPEYTSSGTVYGTQGSYFGFNYTQDDGSSVCELPTDDYTNDKPNVQFEFDAQASNDAGISAFNGPVNFCASNKDIEVTIKNYGVNIINTLTINWEFDNIVQTPIVWTTPLDTVGGAGTNASLITLGNKTFAQGQTYDLKVWTSNPNNMQDTLNVNDTLSLTLGASLFGNLTIGGTTPDYPTFQSAASALNVFGICGPVVFDVRDGVYNEQLTINQIVGASEVNTITFQSETGDSTAVTLQATATLSNHYTVGLFGADYITFKEMTLEALSPTYGRIIQAFGIANYNTFESCVFQGISITTTSSNFALYYNDSNVDARYTTFNNNLFLDGSYGIYHFGFEVAGPPIEVFQQNNNNLVGEVDETLVVINNKFQNQYRSGMSAYENTHPRVHNNMVTTTSSYTSFYGLFLTTVRGSMCVEKNRININNGGFGIYLNNIDATNSDSTYAANNFITMSGTNIAVGLYCTNSNNVGLYFNNVNILSTSNSSNSAALRIFNNNTISVLNNVLVNDGGGYVFNTNGWLNEVVEYNNMYSSSPFYAYVSNNNYSNLADLQVAGYNQNGVSIDPLYVSSTDLHVQEGLLNKAGTPVALITDDIDGDSRDALTPDIGADEFQAVALDVGSFQIISPFPPFAPGVQDIVAEIRNYGEDTLVSANLDWRLNGTAGTTYNWTGTLAAGESEAVVLASGQLFETDSIYSILVWSSSPNGSVDVRPQNDTTSLDNITPSMVGPYTIGGVTPDYVSFQLAVDDLHSRGIAGAVTFNVRDGIYNEQIQINQILGVSEINTITFQSESGDSTLVTLQTSASSFANYTVLLNNADYLTFKNMTLEAQNISYGRIVYAQGSTNHNRFENCVFQGISTTSSSTVYALYYSEYEGDGRYTTFTNNYFKDGSMAIYHFGYNPDQDGGGEGEVFQFGNFSNDPEQTLTITNNIFENQYRYGILANYNKLPLISDNLLTTTSSYSSFFGIELGYSTKGLCIQKNTINITNGGYGVRLTDNIVNIDSSYVANNFISMLNGSTATGIYLNYSNEIGIYHNNINVVANSTSSNASAIRTFNSNDLSIINNILINTGGSYALNLNGSNLTIDYNDIYTTAINYSYLNNTSYPDLAALQGAGFNANGFSIDPLFTSDTNLHVEEVLLNKSGLAIAAITEDIDGEPRNPVAPDIGADEFLAQAIDMGVASIVEPLSPFAPGNKDVIVEVRNFGEDTITNVDIEWILNGITGTTYNWTGSIATGEIDTVIIANELFEIDSVYNLVTWTSMPNGTTDLKHENDTMSIYSVTPALIGTYTIGGATPDFPDFTSAVTALTTKGAYGPVTFNVRDGFYNEQISITDFPGAECGNLITFQAESGDSTAVTLTFAGTSATNYVVQLDGVNGIVFQYMSLASSGSYARVVDIRNGASCNKFLNTQLLGVSTTSTSDFYSLVYSPSVDVELNNEFRNNLFKDGSYGIQFTGVSNYSDPTGLIIDNNTFTEQRYFGIYTQYMDGTVISNNTLTATNSYSSYRSIYLTYSEQGSQITGNYMSTDQTGIYVYYSNSTAAAPTLIANNVIVVEGTGVESGINIYNSDYVDIYHNSVNMVNNIASSAALYAYSSAYINLQNNILSNEGGGYAINNISSFFNWTTNNNDLFTTGEFIAYHSSGNPVVDLSEYQMLTGEFQNCISVDPFFAGSYDLHPKEIDLNGNAMSIASIIEDHDGTIRNATAPDIGAYEFDPPPVDAGILAVTNPVVPFLTGDQEVIVVLKNHGANTLTSVDIEWEFTTFPKLPVSWTGSLASGDTTHVLLDLQSFASGTINIVKAWTTMPNGIADTFNANDTTLVTGLNPALTGTYTIGGVTPDFVDFTDAVDALTNNGIIDSVIFEVRSGTYGEQISIPEILGASCSNPIVFRSESGNIPDVVLSFGANSGNNYTIQLDGAKGITFENMTIESANVSYSTVISMINGASCNEFSYNNIDGANTTSTNTSRATININGAVTPCDDNIFINNLIQGGSYSLYFLGNSTDLSSGLVLDGNEFINPYYKGLRLSYLNNFAITNCNLNTTSTYSSFYGVEVSSGAINSSFIKNTINMGRGYGLYVSSANNSINTPFLIANNFIAAGGTTSNTIGVYLSYNDYVNFYNNSVHVYSESFSSSPIYTFNNLSVKINNNNFANGSNGYAFDYYGNYTADNNNYYGTYTFLGKYQGNELTDLAALQASSGWDANSISAPVFFSSPTDLHTTQILLNGQGGVLAEVTDDIDGETRDATNPDIGADEFSPTLVDAQLTNVLAPVSPILAGTRDVVVELYNNGLTTLDSTNIYWTVNGIPQTPFLWIDTLETGDYQSVTIGGFTFSDITPYNIVAWSDSPNGQADQYVVNDTIYSDPLYVGLAGDYYVGGLNADFNNFTEVAAALSSNGLAGPVNFIVRSGIYNETMTLGEILGNTPNNPVSFYSEVGDSSAVTLNYTSSGTVNFSGAKYLTFRNLGFANTNGRNILIQGTSSNLTFENCLFQGRNVGSTSSSYVNIYCTSTKNDSLVFLNNTMRNGSFGVYILGNGSNHDNGLRIEGNTISDFYYQGIYVNDHDGTLVKNNKITSYSNYSSKYGINIVDNEGAYEISGNRIELDKANTGIYLSSCGTGTTQGRLFNNFVNAGGTVTTYGIRAYNTQLLDMYYNTINVTSTGANTYALYLDNNTGVNVLNNILANTAIGYAFYTNSTSSITASDYNDLYTGGLILGYFNGDHTDLSAWQTASGRDANSFSVDPMFVSPTDLHVTQANLDGTGFPIVGIDVDIDNQTRNETTPDIGADEFGAGLAINDLGVTALINPVSDCNLDELANVTVRIQNFGTDTLTGFEVAYSINDTLEVIENVGGLTISGGNSGTYTFTTPMLIEEFDLYNFNTYTLVTGDTNMDNDSLGALVIQRYPNVVPVASNDTIICEGQYVYITASGGSNYRWRQLPSNYVFSYSSAVYASLTSIQEYEVEVINSYGCSARDTIVVDVIPKPATPSITSSGTFSSCSDDSITLTSSIAEDIFWSTGETTQSIFITQPGTYEVTHVDTLTGCTSVAYRSINGSPTPYLSGSNSICEGSSASISVINGNTYQWSTGEVSSSISVSPLVTTSYSVTITNSAGCVYNRSKTITVLPVLPPPVIVDITEDTAMCYGTGIRLEVVGNASSYYWSNGSYGRFNYVNPSNTTTYTVTATNGNCSSGSDSESVTVSVLPIPVTPIIVATGSSTLTFCDADSILLTSSNFPDSLIWSTGATSQSIWVYQPATYSVSHINSSNCPATKSITLINPPKPYITGNTTICEGETSSLVVQNGLSYLWSNGSTDQTISVTPSGSTRYYCDIVNSSNCFYTDSIDITVIPVPTIDSISIDATICSGTPITLNVEGTALEFIWSTGDIGNSITVSPTETTTYSVNAYNGLGCNQFDDASVMVTTLPLPAKPVISPTQDTIIICQSGSVELTSNIGTNIVWADGATTASVTAIAPGTYIVTHYDGNNCENSDTVVVEFPITPVLTTSTGITTLCEGDAITITASEGDIFDWSTGATTMAIAESPLVSTTYSVTITNAQGCIYYKSIDIEVIPVSTIVGAVTNMVPADGLTDVATPIALSWAPATNATLYDLYIWDIANGQPATPMAADLDQINYVVNNSVNLQSGSTYNWRVVAKNLCMETPGPIQTFIMRDFPDLTLTNVQAPSTAFSGQNISVDYEVYNIGNGNTLQQWIDGVYISADSMLDTSIDTYLGGASNQSFLAGGGSSYAQTASVTLPQGLFGQFYFFVVADSYNNISEADETNNNDFSSPASIIDLTPPPDLQVTFVNSPKNVFSGTNINVTYTISNEGGGNTLVSTWKDKVYFSQDEIFDEASANFLGEFPHNGFLTSGDSYTATNTVMIPNGIYGKYYFHVEADSKNNVYEYVYEENNIATGDSINVILTPPTDFLITNINSPDSASIREPVAIEWTVQNQGGSPPNSPTWRDRIYLSSSPVLDVQTAKSLSVSYQSGTTMFPGDSYTRSQTVGMPDNISGLYYIHVRTDDINDVYEYINENNNVTSIPIEILHPDLTITNIVNPAIDTAGQMMTLTWDTKNNGPGTVFSESWKEQIMISNSPVYDDELVKIIGELSIPTGVLEAESSRNNELTVMIPNGYDGTYYLYVETDYKERIYEEADTLNNRVRSNTAIDVTLGPWADLAVTDVILPDSILAGSTIPLTYFVENMGMADASGEWLDKVYLSANPVWVHPDSAILLTQFLVQDTVTLAIDSTYSDSTMVTIPMLQGGLANNTCYVYIFADADDDVYERFDTLNNVVPTPVFVTAPKLDLNVRCFMAPNQAMTGDTIDVRWINENLGDYTALTNYWYWYDGLYISQDTIFDPTDVFITDWAIFGDTIHTNQYIVHWTPAVLPESIYGQQYLFMVADHTDLTDDIDLTNNATTRVLQNVLVRDVNGEPEPINITLRDPADLTVSNFEAPVVGTSGQPIDIVWTVTNQGVGPTNGTTWNDKFYLSNDFTLDNNDKLIGNYTRSGELEAGESYTDTLQAFLPSNYVGNYIVLMKTDVNGIIYEHQAENNNEASTLINIVQPPPSDLIVTSIAVPANATTGNLITIDWNIKNVGLNPATGYMSEAIYFSEDDVFDVSDVLMTIETPVINLAPNTVETHTVTTPLPGLPFGDYYVIVQTDLLNNIFETIDTNNISSSVDIVNVDVEELPLNVVTPNTLNDNSPIYYQIIIPDTLIGESLLIDLTTNDVLGGANEMYLSYGEVPSRSSFDYNQDDIVQGNQDLVVPILQQGVYYLTVYGSSPPGTQNVDLLATILEFEIREVDSDVGGNSGTITVQIDGSKYIEGMTAMLDDAALGTIVSTDIIYIDPTRIFVTFDLNGASTGLYDVILEKSDGETAVLADGFEVEDGLGEVLLKNILHPPNARFNRTVAISIQFTNAGNNDLPIPIRRIISLRDAPVSFSISGLDYGIKDLYMEFRELNGPQNVLRPSAIGSYTVYSRANTSQRLRFKLVE